MYNGWCPLIGYMFIAYMFGSFACLIGYGLYKVVNKIKTRFKESED